MAAIFEFDHHNIQHYKFICHSVQAVLLFFNFVLELIVFAKAASTDGRVGWQFGLLFLTIPALVFLTMTVRFPRTRKFAHPYALATLDFLFAILWISGFTAQASFNSSGKCAGACKFSKAIVGLSVVTWLIWVMTTILSLYGVMYWKREGYLPGLSRMPYNTATIDPDKEAFSTAPYDDEYVAVHHTDEQDSPYYHTPLANPTHNSIYEGIGHTDSVTSPHSNNPHEDTAYTGYNGASGVASGRFQFPEARYDNV
ncbi:putative chaperone-binding protein [Golovinomyces cichoracearum]|uniref:Putative chaperone-binding protein n=1 Tax=Golovinomyces cichoracearum TaxID=62708 RepID=A0A420J0A7_9PEZI|nr:putative chaperone-binding protein [Golovinomyces cichoracearum]